MVFDRTHKTLNPSGSWTEIWHLWTVIVPRRSINGQFVVGKVWRRHDGGQWIYKRFTEYSGEEAPAAIARKKMPPAEPGALGR